MTSLRPWLRPTLLGPLCTMWGFATFGAVLVGAAAMSNGQVDTWAVLMLWATLLGSTMGVVTVGVDVWLLKLKWRSLPTGGRAWMSSMLTPVLVYVVWSRLWWLPETALGVFAFVILPIVGCAFATRIMLGTRP